MITAFPYLLGLSIGLITGLFYFGGLWFTVKKVPFSKKPNRLLALSTVVRLVPTLAIMFIIIRKDPGMFVATLLAFFAVRFIMIRRVVNQKDIIPTDI